MYSRIRNRLRSGTLMISSLPPFLNALVLLWLMTYISLLPLLRCHTIDNCPRISISFDVHRRGTPKDPRNGGRRKRNITPMLDVASTNLLEKLKLYQSEVLELRSNHIDALQTRPLFVRLLIQVRRFRFERWDKNYLDSSYLSKNKLFHCKTF